MMDVALLGPRDSFRETGNHPRFPLRLQLHVDFMVDEMIVEPFGIALAAFVDETEPWWNGAAARIARGAGDDEAVEIERGEGVIDERLATRGDEALALLRRGDPISESGIAVLPVDAVIARYTDDAAIEKNGGVNVVIGLRLLHDFGEKLAGVRDRSRAVKPGQPVAQMGAAGIEDGEKLLGIAHGKLAKTVPVVDAMEIHGRGNPRGMTAACETISKSL